LRSPPQFIKQPRVLNGDDGLIGEGPEKRNLLIRKRINFGSSKRDCSDRHSLTQEWNASCRPMSKPSCESTSFGEFLDLCLEVDYMNGLPIDNGTAIDAPTRARETNANLLGDRTPVGGRMQVLPVEFKNGHVIRFAETRRTPRDNLKHDLECARRSTDDLKNLRCGRLLFLRLVQCAGEPRDFSFLAERGIATVRGLWRIAALQHYRFAMLLFNLLAASFGALSHCLSYAQDKAS
jgi:hypothetical protein